MPLLSFSIRARKNKQRNFDYNGTKAVLLVPTHFSFSLFHLFGFLLICFSPLVSVMCACLPGCLIVPPLLCGARLEMQAIRSTFFTLLGFSVCHHNSFMGSETEDERHFHFSFFFFQSKQNCRCLKITPRCSGLFCYRWNSVLCLLLFTVFNSLYCTRSRPPFHPIHFPLPQGFTFTRTGRSSSCP